VEPPKRIVPLYLFGYLAVAILIAVLGTFGFAPSQTGALVATGSEAVATRLAPVAHVEFASTAAAAPAHPLRAGEAVYAGLCVACHGAGLAGSPKLGDKAAWGPRIKQGFDTLVKHATEGYKAMPPKGGGTDLDPQEVARAVAWMADQGGASFKEP